MNLIIKRSGQSDKVVAVTFGDLIYDRGRVSIEVNAPGGKTYYIPLVPGPIPQSEEEPS